MSLPPPRSLLFGFNCWLAAMLALAVAFSCELRNPWWAMLTVFITSQPIAGAVVSKAVYRVLGTLAGICGSLLIVPNLVDAPELMILAIALWIGLGLYLSLLKRGPEGYALMLAGYTIALVGLPPLDNPYGIFDTAVARAEEIVIGVLSAVLVHGLLFPRSAESVVVAKLAACLRDARNWIVAALAPDLSFPEQQARKRLAADLTELSLLAAHLPFEPLARHSALGIMRALEQRMIGLLPLLSAVEDRLATLAACGPVPEVIARLAAELRAWVAQDDAGRAAQLLIDCQAAMPEAAPDASWAEVVTVSLIERIEELVNAWRDTLELARLLREPQLVPSEQLLPRIRRASSRVLHIDHGLAALSGFAAVCGVLAAGAFAVLTNWSEGFTAVSIAGVLSCLFATADDPTPMLRRMLVWTLLAIPVAMLYVFAILPAIDGFPLLALVLFPPLVTVGAFMAMPQHSLRALAFAIGLSAGMALQPRFGSDFVGFAIGNIGVVIGTVTALLVTSFIRVVRGEANARRILRAGWRELAGLATDKTPLTREAWASRMLDRLALLLPRLAQADPASGLHLSDALNDLRLGVNIVDLRNAAEGMHRWPFTQVTRLMERFAAHFRNVAADGPREPDAALARQIDAVIAELLRVESRELRLHGVAASVGLRRNLFPTAPPYADAN